MRSRVRATVETKSGNDIGVEHHNGDDRILLVTELSGGGDERELLLERVEAIRVGINLVIAGMRAMIR